MRQGPRSLFIRRHYAHSKEKVFKAFASATALEQWFSPHDSIKTKLLTFDFKVGGRYRFLFTLEDGTQAVLGGEYLEINFPNSLRLSWCWEEPDPHAGINSMVNIAFEDQDGGTELVVTHEQLNAEGMRQRHEDGWHGSLNRLRVKLDHENEK